jgi:hypothetical protein
VHCHRDAETEVGSDRRTALIAGLGTFCVIFSWLALNYEDYLIGLQILNQQPPFITVATEQLLRLCPVLVLILFRRIALIAVPYALVAFGILIGRCYYLSKLYLLGVNALPRSFDWASLLQSILGRISIAVLFFWVFIKLIFLLSDALKGKTE